MSILDDLATLSMFFDYQKVYRKKRNPNLDDIDKVICNGPATIIIDRYGYKTVVKCQNNDKPDIVKGLLMCLLRYSCDSNTYHDVVHTFMVHDNNSYSSNIFDDNKREFNVAYAVLIYIYGKKKLEKWIRKILDKYGIIDDIPEPTNNDVNMLHITDGDVDNSLFDYIKNTDVKNKNGNIVDLSTDKTETEKTMSIKYYVEMSNETIEIETPIR